jgi:hypothetical protein
MNNRARFSGRQKKMALILSPAEAGLKIISGPVTRALICSTLSLSLLCLTGCPKAKNSTGSGGNGSGGGPPEVTSSENVVHLGGAGAGVTVTGSQTPTLTIQVPINIDEGYHINANPATFSYLIATEVTAEKVEGIDVGKPVYPAAVKKKFQFADQPLAVYEGNVNVTLPLTAHFTGTRSLPISVRVQACDQEKCFPPATLHATYPITVDAK